MFFDKIRNNFYFRVLAMKLLMNKFFIGNFLYKKVLGSKIKRTIERIQECPPVLLIELTNYCNADCKICVRHHMTRPVGFMFEGLYNKIIDELSSWGNNHKEIILVGFGETVLEKNLIERVKYSKLKGINKVQMFTNGFLLNHQIIDSLIESGLDEVVFSIDSIDPDKYEDIRHIRLDKVLDNLEYLLKMSKKTGIGVIINSVAYEKSSLKEIEKIYKKYKNRAKAVVFNPASNWVGVNENLDYSLFNCSVYTNGNKPPCPHLWSYLPIRWNGDVSLCCMDFDSRVSIGNLNSESIRNVWTGSRLSSIRNLHLTNRSDELTVCRDCNFYRNWWMR